MPVDTNRVQEVFLAVVQSEDPAIRAEVLDRECADDWKLRLRVETLLHAHDQSDDLLDVPIVAPLWPWNASVLAPVSEAFPGHPCHSFDDLNDVESVTRDAAGFNVHRFGPYQWKHIEPRCCREVALDRRTPLAITTD